MTHTGKINGYPFSYQRKHSEHFIRLGKYETPGRWGSAIDQFKAGGIEFTIDVLAHSVTELDDILAAIMTEGRGSFSPGHPHDGWHYTGVAGDLSSDLRLSHYVPDRGYPLSFLFCSDLPFMLSDVVHSRGVFIETTGATWSTDSCYPGNLIKNYTFSEWTNGTVGSCPDNWFLGEDGMGGTIVSTPELTGSHTYLITGDNVSPTIGEIYQPIAIEAGKTYLIGCWVFKALVDRGYPVIELVVDGVSTHKEDLTLHFGDYMWFSFEYTFTTQPSNVMLKLYAEGTPNNDATFGFNGPVVMENTNYEKNEFGNSLTTSGKFPAIPDVEISAAYFGVSGPEPGSSYVVNDKNGWGYWSQNSGDWSIVSEATITVAAVAGVSHRIDAAKISQMAQSASYDAYVRVTLTTPGWNGGAEGTILEYATKSTSYVTRNSLTYGTPVITCSENTPFTVKLYLKTANSSYKAYGKTLSVSYTEMGSTTLLKDVVIYNTADQLTKLQVANTLFPGSKIRINADDTGKYTYIDDFSTNVYSFVATVNGSVTYSPDNKNVAIADTAYLRYPFDVKYPITGIPLLVLYVNSGTPQVYIAADNSGSPGTFYACDNNPSTNLTNVVYTYLLNNDANIQLKNTTKFYVKIIPPAGSTCTISNIQLYCDLITVDAERPLINLGTSNMFKIEMSANAGCFVSLYYHDRKVGI